MVVTTSVHCHLPVPVVRLESKPPGYNDDDDDDMQSADSELQQQEDTMNERIMHSLISTMPTACLIIYHLSIPSLI